MHVYHPLPIEKNVSFSPSAFDVGINTVLKRGSRTWNPVLFKISQIVIK